MDITYLNDCLFLSVFYSLDQVNKKNDQNLYFDDVMIKVLVVKRTFDIN